MNVCMYECMSVGLSVCLYVCMCICMFVLGVYDVYVSFHQLGVLFVGVLIIRALLFGLHIRAPAFGNRPICIIHICTFTYIYMYICIFVCAYIRIHVCMIRCRFTYVHIYARIFCPTVPKYHKIEHVGF